MAEEMAVLAAVNDTLEEQQNPKSPTTPVSEEEKEEKDTSDNDSSEEELNKSQEKQKKRKVREEEPRSDKGGKAPKYIYETPKILAFFGPDFLVHRKNFRARRYYIQLEDGTQEWRMSYSWEQEKAKCVEEFWSQENVLHWVPAKGSNKATRGTMDSFYFNTTTHQDGKLLKRVPNPHFTPKGGKKPLTAIIPLQVGPLVQSQSMTPEAPPDLIDFCSKFQDSMTQIETSLSAKISSLLEPVIMKINSQTELVEQITSKLGALTESQLLTQKQTECFQTCTTAFFTNMQDYFVQSHSFSMTVQQSMMEANKRMSDSFDKSNLLMQSLTSNVESIVKNDLFK